MTGGGGCCCRRSGKVGPELGSESECQIVEIRPKRKLRIRHINKVPRDEKFQKEMETFLAYRHQGYPSNFIASGPLTMPKRRIVSENPRGPQNDMLPNATNMTPDPSRCSSLPNGDVLGLESKESTFSLGPPQQSTGVHSASSVMVALNSEEADENIRRTTNLSNNTEHSSKGNTEAVKSSSYDSVLFFFHGVGGSSDIWTPQMEFFANQGYEIVAPDLMGHGFSDTPSNAKAYLFDEILADLEEIFDKYCKRKNVIIGHSYGCSFAAVLGRRRARRVTKLILISGGGPTPLNPQPGVFTLPVCVLGCVRPCVECSFKRSAFSSSKKPVISPEATFSVPTYVLRHTMNGQIWPDGDELFHNWLMCPTLLIYGLKDELVSLQEEKDMEQAIFQSRLAIIEDASHMVMIESPTEVNHLIKEFLLQSSEYREDISSPPREQVTASRMSQVSLKSVRGVASKSMR